MSSGVYYRSWMDKPHMDPNTNLLTEEYVQGIGEFMKLVEQQPDAKTGMSDEARHSASRRSAPRGGRGSSASSSRPSGSYHEQNSVPAYAPAPAPYVPAPAAQEDPGVMSVQQLVQQLGREHLSVLHPNPRPGHTTWFDKSSNGISRSINNMMYSILHTGYSKWNVIPREDRQLWFRQFAVTL
ncbi:hypothetical protein DY000_02028960 [Brassica cretica]|uniref:Uncharacterized protein n=1 Tax=Brassica cretica TaxID=69181 RepID=A0ABQ7DWI3_BRACR|nr:hypothetical protein DY000_02028960 [Brassica cretica]